MQYADVKTYTGCGECDGRCRKQSGGRADRHIRRACDGRLEDSHVSQERCVRSPAGGTISYEDTCSSEQK